MSLDIARGALLLLAASGLTQAQISLNSTILDEERRPIVRLPRHYAPDTAMRYPVLYKLDGDNQLDWDEHTIDVLQSVGTIPDLIVVAIPNGRGMRNRDLTPARRHQEGIEAGDMGTGELGRGDRFLDFIEKELIPVFDSRALRTFVYFNWGEAENEGMGRSHAAVRALLEAEAPRGLRWKLERARDAKHQQTPVLAVPTALHSYFSGRTPR